MYKGLANDTLQSASVVGFQSIFVQQSLLADLPILFGIKNDQGEPFVIVTLVHVEGSVPHNVGRKMIVTAGGLDHGTVGGGRIEAKAIEHAIKMIVNGPATDLVR